MSKGLLLKLENELKLRNYSQETIKGYVFSVKKLLEYSKDKGINKEIFKEYLLEKLKTQNPSTVAKDLFAIEFFFEHILKQKVSVPKPKRNKTLPNILTIKEIRKLIESTKNLKHKLIIKLLYGDRKSTRLNSSHIPLSRMPSSA